MGRLTKKVLKDFARTVKNGIIGNSYILYTDGTILESVNGQDFILGLAEYVTVEAKEGWTIQDYLRHIDLIRSEQE